MIFPLKGDISYSCLNWWHCHPVELTDEDKSFLADLKVQW